MYAQYVRDRITQLRIQKGVSEYKMSYDLGHSRGYVNNISSGKSLPSMAEFFAICEYFDITPVEFFDGSLRNPKMTTQLQAATGHLNEVDQSLLLQLAQRLSGQ